MAARTHDPIGTALERIASPIGYGKKVSVTKKGKALQKWGRLNSSASGTWETVQSNGGTETLLTANSITVLDTTNASDAGKTVTVEGHYLTASNDLVFIVQSKTLTGLTAVALDTPIARCSRLYISSGQTAVGTITVNAGEGGTAYNRIVAGDSQSEKAATSISYKDFYIITSFGASILGNNNAAADFRAELKLPGGPWRPQARWSLKGDNTDYTRYTDATPFVIPANSDIRIRVNCSTAGTQVSAWFDGLLAIDEAYLNMFGNPLSDPAPA